MTDVVTDALAHFIVKSQIAGLRSLEKPALLEVLLLLTKDDSARRLALLVLAAKEVLGREKSDSPVDEADRSTLGPSSSSAQRTAR